VRLVVTHAPDTCSKNTVTVIYLVMDSIWPPNGAHLKKFFPRVKKLGCVKIRFTDVRVVITATTLMSIAVCSVHTKLCGS
jgi:hypothetical protein